MFKLLSKRSLRATCTHRNRLTEAAFRLRAPHREASCRNARSARYRAFSLAELVVSVGVVDQYLEDLRARHASDVPVTARRRRKFFQSSVGRLKLD